MKRLTFLSAIAVPLLAIAAPAMAQNDESSASQAVERSPLQMRADQVLSAMTGEIELEQVFTDGFLRSVPPEQFSAFSTQMINQFGAPVSIEDLDPPTGNRAAITIRMERALARGVIGIDPDNDNKVYELLLQSFEPIDDTPEKIAADLSALPGNVSYWFGPLDGSEPVLSDAVGDQMAIGSTFKLYVLATLAREVSEGKRSWEDVVTLDDHRSFPSGMMQDWPDDAPVSLMTLANLMISISDNTATDMLIRTLGKDAVLRTMIDSGHSAPELNDPFLTTREMFLLKGGPDARLSTYQAAEIDVRAQILSGIEEPAVPTSQIQAKFSGSPVALDVEWFASAADLAKLFQFMRETADPRAFEVMAINTSMPGNVREKWSYAGYKGGSEPGVLNLTWLLTDGLGTDHMLALSWNNTEANLDNTALEVAAQRILGLAR